MNHTRKIPRVMLIDINGLDELGADRLLIDLSPEIKSDEFFISRVESEPWKWELIVINLRLCKHVFNNGKEGTKK